MEDHGDGAPGPVSRPDERIIEFGPDADDALQATLRVFANAGMVVSIVKIDGSVVDVVPVLVDGGQILGAKWTTVGGRSEETVIVRIAEVAHLRVL